MFSEAENLTWNNPVAYTKRYREGGKFREFEREWKKEANIQKKRIFRIKSIWLTTKGSAMSERGWITSRLISSVSTPLRESEDPTSVNTLLPPSWEIAIFLCSYLQRDNTQSVFWHPKGENYKHDLAMDICPFCGLCSVWNSFLLGGFLPLWQIRTSVPHWRLQILYTHVKTLTCTLVQAHDRGSISLTLEPWTSNLTWQSEKAEVLGTLTGSGGGVKRLIMWEQQ